MTANAYLKALEMVNERETKAFIIRQLQMLGKDECIETLASYLNDESLSGPAARALAANGSEKAGQALVAALKRRSRSPKTQKRRKQSCWRCREQPIRICRKRSCMP